MQIDFKTSISAEIAHIFVPVIIQSDESLADRLNSFFDTDIHLAGIDQAGEQVREQKGNIALAIPYHNGLLHFNLIPIDTDENYRQIKDKTRKVFQKHKLSLEHSKNVLYLGQFNNGLSLEQCQAILHGFCLHDYEVGIYKTNLKPTNKNIKLDILCSTDQAHSIQSVLNEALELATTQKDIFKLVDAPSNKKSPAVLAQYAQKVAEEGSPRLKTQVYELEAIKEHGFFGLLAVNQASPTPPVFIKMEYRCGNPDAKHIGIVGKGVTFDTGGVSLKRSANLHLMKSDMGGGAAVLGLMRLADKLQLDINLTGIVPSTDNSIGQEAIKPSDVISSYSGKTIEIIDTDAEGRLLLADGLSYMEKNYNPDLLLDIATLTGSCITALGTFAAGFISNNPSLSNQLMKSGYSTGEKVWELPNWDEYNTLIRSNVADVKNFSGYPRAGAITAAKFLQHFIGDHSNWAHLDIAGMAMESDGSGGNQVATAFGLHLMLDLLKHYEG